jgi:hypothetical protein
MGIFGIFKNEKSKLRDEIELLRLKKVMKRLESEVSDAKENNRNKQVEHFINRLEMRDDLKNLIGSDKNQFLELLNSEPAQKIINVLLEKYGGGNQAGDKIIDMIENMNDEQKKKITQIIFTHMKK